MRAEAEMALANGPISGGTSRLVRHSTVAEFLHPSPSHQLRTPSASKRGFTLLEALVAVALISVGIVATLNCLAAMGRSRARVLESEEMQRLALRKYDEILALGTLTSGRSDGDFRDLGEPRFTWRAVRQATGTGNLDTFRVQVTRVGDTYDHAAEVQGLICRPLATGGGR